MGLYLTVFDDSGELDGVEIGSYSDFSTFRQTVVCFLESGKAGARFPTLILHSDCDGKWSPQDASALVRELEVIADEFRRIPPLQLSGWQAEVAKTTGVRIENLYDCFFDIDGEPLLDRLSNLAKLSEGENRPILFQ